MKLILYIKEGKDTPCLIRKNVNEKELDKRKEKYIDVIEQTVRKYLKLTQEDTIECNVEWKI